MPPPAAPSSSFNSLAPQQDAAILDLPNRRGSLISLAHIAETGSVPVNGWLGTLAGNPDMKVNLDADDAYVHALRQMVWQGMAKLRGHPDAGQLLSKPVWDKADRAKWELTLSETVAAEMKAIPSFDTYRTATPQSRPAEQTYDVRRSASINQLAQDITASGKPSLEFDCEQMSVTLGLAMHFVEKMMLPPADAPETLRAAHHYYYTVGMAHNIKPKEDAAELAPGVARNPISGHALLVSGATGNFIEATNNNPDRFNPGYKEINTPGYDFQSFLRSGIAVLDHRIVFADTADMSRAQAAAEQDALINWCVRKVEIYGETPPALCQTPAVQTVLSQRKPSSP